MKTEISVETIILATTKGNVGSKLRNVLSQQNAVNSSNEVKTGEGYR